MRNVPSEDEAKRHYETLVQDFEEKWGIDITTASLVFQEDAPLMRILKHVYIIHMDDLREAVETATIHNLQGASRILWDLMNIPKELEKMRGLE